MKKIKEEIKKVKECLKIDYFPTSREIIETTGNSALRNVIAKTGGWRKWAEELNLPIRSSETMTGELGEDSIRDLLIEKGYDVEDMSTCASYDLLLNRKVRIDVKTSNLYHGTNGNFYSCSFGKKNHDCDLFIVKAIDDNKNERFLVIPVSKVMNQSQISIGEFKSKWYSYENKFDFIEKYLKFYETL